jgi:hypothetical protein
MRKISERYVKGLDLVFHYSDILLETHLPVSVINKREKYLVHLQSEIFIQA